MKRENLIKLVFGEMIILFAVASICYGMMSAGLQENLSLRVALPVALIEIKPVQSEQLPPPALDISGLAIIQALPVGGLEEWYIRKEAVRILSSLANLAVMQFNVQDKKFNLQVKDPVTGKEETIIGGEFGRILRKEILAFNPENEDLLVRRTEFVKGSPSPEFDEDRFEIKIGTVKIIELVLRRDMGWPEKGFPEWGIKGLKLKYDLEGESYPPKTMELDFGMDVIKGKGTAWYSKRHYAPDGNLIKWETWKFEAGKPNHVSYESGTTEPRPENNI